MPLFLCLLVVITQAYCIESIRVIAQPDDAVNEAGKVALFRCIFNDEPPLCLWTKDGSLILEDVTTYRLVGHKDLYDCSLEVFLPDSRQNHTFQCLSPEIPDVTRSVKSRVATLFSKDGQEALPLVQDLVTDTPLLTVGPIDQTVHEHGTVTLECKFSRPPPKCIWLKDGDPLYLQNDFRYSMLDENSSDCTLRIDNVTESAEGSYACEAPETVAGPSVRSQEARVTVIRPPASISIFYEDEDLSGGEIRPLSRTVNASCVVKECRPKPTQMFWRFRNETIPAKMKTAKKHSYVAEVSVLMDDETREQLECVVRHPGLEDQEATVSVTVVVVPEQRLPVVEYEGRVLRHGETVLVQEGTSLGLKCVSPASDCRTVSLSWLSEGWGNSTPSTDYTCRPGPKRAKGDAVVEFSGFPVNDALLYCQAKHAHLDYILEAKVQVQVFSPLTKVRARFDSRDGDELAVLVNGTVNLTCEADGNLPTSYRWFSRPKGRDDLWRQFEEGKKVTVVANEAASYSCRANNGYDPKWYESENDLRVRIKEAVTRVEVSFSRFPGRKTSFEVDEGRVSVTCVADGDPPVSFLWYERFNDSMPWSRMNETRGGDGASNVHVVSVHSEGWYKCSALNEASLGVHVDSQQLFVTMSSHQRRRSSSSAPSPSWFVVFVLLWLQRTA